MTYPIHNSHSIGNALEPRKIDELIAECIAEIGGEKGLREAILKAKADLIENIFRVKHQSRVIHAQHLKDISPENWWSTFCHYYDKDLPWLDNHLKELSNELTTYMRNKMYEYMSKPPIPASVQQILYSLAQRGIRTYFDGRDNYWLTDHGVWERR